MRKAGSTLPVLRFLYHHTLECCGGVLLSLFSIDLALVANQSIVISIKRTFGTVTSPPDTCLIHLVSEALIVFPALSRWDCFIALAHL
jgi:hypothetical protein